MLLEVVGSSEEQATFRKKFPNAAPFSPRKLRGGVLLIKHTGCKKDFIPDLSNVSKKNLWSLTIIFFFHFRYYANMLSGIWLSRAPHILEGFIWKVNGQWSNLPTISTVAYFCW